MLERIISLYQQIKNNKPLVHCLTNHITINDCANILLAAGAKPIMAEHPSEVGSITASADALAVNLGNISDLRMKSMLISGRIARKQNIPITIDLTGIAASPFRLDFAAKFIKEAAPQLIKGNISEIKTLFTGVSTGRGVDASTEDKEMNPLEVAKLAFFLANEYNAVILASGEIDVIADKDKAVCLQNGDKMLANITGTGCMQTVLASACTSTGDVFSGAVLGATLLAISGEIAAQSAKGPAAFKIGLFDVLYKLASQDIADYFTMTEVYRDEV